ncbi:hypothetical protein QBC42DRAFT_226132 [Cladorrhinum samala]|uniref:Uncharacterized protein n=1 Tax=Cladorrhinum samala TaxID=585594 RepID=A0AAV9HNP5_9PEZI|nr:hypothetical protein QBC42DRAFT_226132 [Cladorrhinum samala]
MAETSVPSINSWFPQGIEANQGWRVDTVTLALLALVGDLRSEEFTRAATASRLIVLPRLVPAMQLLNAARPARLPQMETRILDLSAKAEKEKAPYFVDTLHVFKKIPMYGFKVLEVRHKIDRNKIVPGSGRPVTTSVRPSHLVDGLLLLGFLLTLGLAVGAAASRDGAALLAICLMGFASSIIGYASSWKLKHYDEVSGLRYGVMMAIGHITLMLSVIMLGNCKWRSQIMIAAAYVLLNVLYWGASLLPRQRFWDMSRYEVRDVTPEDASGADIYANERDADDCPSHTRSLWYAMREVGECWWAEKWLYFPKRPDKVKQWVDEAEHALANRNREWRAGGRQKELEEEKQQ